jgi:hypothetical protein
VAVGTGASLTLTVGVAALAAVMLADWLFELSWPVRAVVFVTGCSAVGWLLYRRVVTPLQHQPDDDDVALFMERSEPGLGGRLISTVQLTRSENESPTLVRALVAQTETLAGSTDFASYVSPSPFMRTVAMLWIVTAMAVAGFVWGRPSSEALLKRAVLFPAPIPRQTKVICITGNQTVAQGERVMLEAKTEGRTPVSGTVTLQFASGRSQTFTMIRADGRFLRGIDNVQESFRYKIRLGDGESDTFRIAAQPRPALAEVKCEQFFPSYTKLPPLSRRLGDLNLLAGSRLTITARATKPIRTAAVKLLGQDKSLPMTVNDRQLTADILIPGKGLTGLQVQLVDTSGLRSADDVTYRVDVLPDRPPEITISYPTRREELITAVAKLVIGFEASDDYGVAQVFLHSRIKDSIATTEFDLKGETPRSLRRRYEWSVTDIKPPLEPGMIIEYWLEARDNNDITGPGIRTSEHYFARIVTAEEKRAELLGRLDDSLRMLLTTTQEQEKLNQNLGDIIRARPTPP